MPRAPLHEILTVYREQAPDFLRDEIAALHDLSLDERIELLYYLTANLSFIVQDVTEAETQDVADMIGEGETRH